VWVPTEVSGEERKTLEKLREAKNFKPGQKSKEERKGLFDRMKDFFGGNG
jgi:molecular chaperone DnaJ